MTVAKYTVGFVMSLLLTIVAYNLVVFRSADPWLLAILAILAIAQMVVQLVFFLHLGDEVRPRYKLASFIFMASILSIVVIGSIWIMNNLDRNMIQMTPNEKSNYMMTQHDKGF
ncbi:MAG: cyoD [Candidatus Saccharibacteria bacterium]|nr:cyoD [Candidatus Saccharibacteria bacterium]